MDMIGTALSVIVVETSCISKEELPDEDVKNTFVCTICKKMSADCEEKIKIKRSQLNHLLGFTCARLKERMDLFPVLDDLWEPRSFAAHGIMSRNALLTHIRRPNTASLSSNGLVMVNFPVRGRRGTKRPKNREVSGFKVNVDVQQFCASDLSVKIVGKEVVVEAEHEERLDEHGYISRRLKRRYTLPEDVEVDLLTSSFSADGILTLFAPRKEAWPMPDKNERIVPIINTASAAFNEPQQKVVTPPTEALIAKGEKSN